MDGKAGPDSTSLVSCSYCRSKKPSDTDRDVLNASRYTRKVLAHLNGESMQPAILMISQRLRASAVIQLLFSS